MKYSDQQRIQKIYDYSEKLLGYIEEKNITKEDLIKDFSLQWLVTTPLYNIGEHAYFLTAEYKADVVFEELPILKKQLDVLL